MERINVAQLVKDCPKGMELDCTMYDRVTFDEVTTVIGFDDKKRVKIILSTHYSDGTKDEINLTEFGTYTDDETAKCVIFPKGKTTWEGFVPPCQFKDGDVIVDKYGAVAIYKRVHSSYEEPYVDFHCGITSEYRSFFVKDSDSLQHCGKIDSIRLATEEEKQELFKSIEDHGYKWNPEYKTLEKLKKEYPKTYEECWKVRFEVDGETILEEFHNVSGYYSESLGALQKLLCCRDAYWKIAGEEMGLDKPWESPMPSLFETVHCIRRKNNKIIKGSYRGGKSEILEFPTEEMRDVFFEDFKDLIEQCKELL